MEKNIGEQLKKAFEAFRQASIEKDSAKKELQQKTEYYEKYTQQLEQKIKDQNQLISNLKSQLNLATKHTSVEGKSCEPGLRKQEVETLSDSDQHPDGMPCVSQGRKQGEDCLEAAVVSPHGLPRPSHTENKDVLDAFRELQGKFFLIRTLAKKQKDHLRKICSGNNSANDQQFSMPIQCTDVTAAQAEGPFSSAVRGEELATASLASRGASPEDGDFMDSLVKLSVKFPPSTDSEYEFLNSTPEKHIEAAMRREGPAMVVVVPAVADEGVGRFPYDLLPPGSPSSPLNPDSIRGPQKLVWSPELCEATGLEGSADLQQNTSPKYCEFCNTLVPQDHIYSHLNSHFLDETSNGH
ncbi:TRAF family member-associated NF-kappa-B activator [Anguilla anguilla]|uniref:TRAF family member-associated NF-kappa-B activator n=1 Tax=Anguilla anguilla TaxID=7936 RepID=UPI0015AE6118|nr:TRAF family member-associated NF-kappa-B activator [Anguilla anguilla]